MVCVRTPYSLIHGYECFEEAFWVSLGWLSKDGGSMSWPKPWYQPVRLCSPVTQKTIILNINIHIPCILSTVFVTDQPSTCIRQYLYLVILHCILFRAEICPRKYSCLSGVFSWFAVILKWAILQCCNERGWGREEEGYCFGGGRLIDLMLHSSIS
jgi:hypothetical protein